MASSLFIKAQQPDWYLKLQKIGISKTDRQAVEEIFNISSVHRENILRFHTTVRYKTPHGYSEVYYSNGRCKENKDSTWNVNENNVLRLIFKPNEPIKPSKLNIKLKDFKEEKSDDTPNIGYTNENAGIRLDILYKKIRLMEFHSTRDQKNRFYCPE
jgi:lipopolysaccharide export LptBFGC system permease protein LptF